MSAFYLLLIGFICFSSTFAFPGEYVPKSFYILDEDGHKSDVVYLRKTFLPRTRRSPSSGGGGSSYGAGFAFDGNAGGADEIAGAVEAGLGSTFNKLRNLAGDISSRSAIAANSGGGGGTSYSASFSSKGGDGGLHGEGPVLYSRFAEGERELVTGGNGRIAASSSSNGPNGAVSFSSSSVDSNGQVRYSTHARKF